MSFNKNFNLKTKTVIGRIAKKQAIQIKKKYSILNKTYSLYVPSQYSLYVICLGKGDNLLIRINYKSYYFNLPIRINTTQLHFDTESNVIYFFNFKTSPSLPLWIKDVSTILAYFITFFFIKIKFKGKGYYIYKNNRNTITPQFGYSHRIYVYSYFNYVRFLTKTKVMIFGFSKKDVLGTSVNIKSKRSINVFTGRGVRFSKQIIYKKTGKVSMYR